MADYHSVIAFLQRQLRPQYVGWEDQYRAILYVLGIPADADWRKALRTTLNEGGE